MLRRLETQMDMMTSFFFSRMTRLISDKSGNFAMISAVMVPVLFAAGSLAIDYNGAAMETRQLQGATDSAALAAAAALVATSPSTTAAAQSLATDYVTGQMANYLSTTKMADLKANTTASATLSTDGGTKTYKVTVNARYAYSLSGLAPFLGKNSVTIAAASQSSSQSESKNAMSMFLVLDRSGSMSWVTDTIKSTTTKCQNYTDDNWSKYPNLAATKPCYVNKSGALKAAAASLFDTLDNAEAADPSNTLIRTGAISFNDSAQTPQALAWGTTTSRTYITALPDYPTGGTDMTTPMDKAYSALQASSEATAQTQKGNNTFSKFIVLMTDGENTGNSSSWNRSLDTKTLATCSSARSAGITIYTVAFMAPSNGQSLLKSCAGVTANYFEADDMSALVSAFQTIAQKASERSVLLTR
jgi:Flp pilus assembly protein TadG